MSNGHGNQSYKERNNRLINQGEQLFTDYCFAQGLICQRIGFDEKQNPVPNFYHLSKTLRQLPDYVVTNPQTNKTGIVSVKGTRKFKEEDYLNLPWLEQTYSTQQAPLWFAFCLTDNICWQTPQQVAKLYEASTTLGEWADGKRYRELSLPERKR
jgi:hypothetical protein